MPEIRALIVDDEPVARAGIRKLLGEDEDIIVVGEAGTGSAAIDAILEHEPDLLFLDIQMPEMNGFDVLAAIGPDTVPAVVFVTAYDQFAVRAFEVEALDYLLKPFDDERFANVLGRAKQHLARAREHGLADRLESLLSAWESRRESGGRGSRDGAINALATESGIRQPARRSRWITRIIVRGGGRVFFQPVEDVDWIEAADYYARLHVGPKTHLVREALTALEDQLDPARFLRVHRSAIVNVSRVSALRPDWRNRHEILLHDGTVVPLSRGRKKAVERLLSRAR
ncbi:MAG TPA: LytTR family DNA-binding domain-containing protein [Longimicrobiales bacterium]|nr:LytTR family DNA-binding domain-containing protein [Longimicrobiales bacterium]